MNYSFGDYYRGRRVLVTGASGFKGSWLSIWLSHLGAEVIGYSLPEPTYPSMFQACGVETLITHVYGDIRDLDLFHQTVREHQPEIVFHLAAQPLVRPSFAEPRRTFEVNFMGTINAIEAARACPSVAGVLLITSDKAYRNLNWEWGYRESDMLGGADPYSASKACAELAIAVYQGEAFQRSSSPVRDLAIASTRAGNVIGGGDWAEDRLVPDTVRAITAGRNVEIRNPTATRPWQHVLEPLSGYLWLGALLAERRELRSAWNFGPADAKVLTVGDMMKGMMERWGSPTQVVLRNSSVKEAMLLRLDCSKAAHHLKWRAAWLADETLDAITAWYRRYYEGGFPNMHSYSVEQIESYTASARRQGILWATPESKGEVENTALMEVTLV